MSPTCTLTAAGTKCAPLGSVASPVMPTLVAAVPRVKPAWPRPALDEVAAAEELEVVIAPEGADELACDVAAELPPHAAIRAASEAPIVIDSLSIAIPPLPRKPTSVRPRSQGLALERGT